RVTEADFPHVLPGETAAISLPLNVPKNGRAYLKITYLLKQGDSLRPVEHELGFDEILLNNEDGRNQTSLKWRAEAAAKALTLPPLTLEENDRQLIISGKAFTYVYDKRTGTFSRLTVDGKDFLDRPMEINIWRAPTDNDAPIKEKWTKAMYHLARSRAYTTDYSLTDEAAEIRSHMAMTAIGVQPMMTMDAIWTIHKDGQMDLNMAVTRDMEFPALPRFGLRLFLPESVNQVTYYGLGPNESYIDKCRASYHGRFESRVKDLHEDYLKPQENGSHADCDYVMVESPTAGLKAFSGNRFSFNASVFTQEELTEKKHAYELKSCGSTVLNLDFRQNGIGSNSCGPELLKKYRFDEETFTYSINLILETGKD
ncbi:MAG: beta-galactosidase, partial [Lachnospiraceae bacterium]|nr:beta-galactosidase [Candidatus Equihabitans merdae]